MNQAKQSPVMARLTRKTVHGDGPMVSVGFRLPAALVDEVDGEAKVMASAPIVVSRTDAVHVLLREALDARKQARGAPKKK